ncbi:MAG: hypothetical protein GXP30_10905, partial [Verrucomicrobia bacterium]|nr:hypothetical protein [Verrucomicrobiota bacterium]
LAELYENRKRETRLLTHEAYEAMGGVEGALGKKAEEVFSKLDASAQGSLEEILPLLVTLDLAGEQSPVRRRAQISELNNTADKKALTEALIEARFLTTDQAQGEAVAAFAHEALLRRWERLIKWINHNRDLLRSRATIEQSARRWQEAGSNPSLLLTPGLPLEEGRQLLEEGGSLLVNETRSYIEQSVDYHDKLERKKQLKRRITMIGMSLLTVAAMVGGLVANKKQQEAAAEKQKADAAREDAEELIGFMLTDLSAKLKGLGKLELMAGVEGAVRDYYKTVPQDEQNIAALEQRAHAHEAASDTFENQGRIRDALVAATEAKTIWDSLFEREPDEIRYRENIANEFRWLAWLEDQEGNLDTAKQHVEAGITLLREVPVDSLTTGGIDTLCKLLKSKAHTLYDKLDQRRKARALVLEMLGYALQISKQNPNSSYWREQVAYGIRACKIMEVETESLWEKFENPGTFSEIMDNLINENPDNFDQKSKLLSALLRENFSHSEKVMQRAQILAEGLTRHDPSNLEWQGQAAEMENRLGVDLYEAGRYKKANQYFLAAEERFERLLNAPHAAYRFRDKYAYHLSYTGLNWGVQGENKKAEAYQVRASKMYEQLIRDHPNRPQTIGKFSLVLLRLSTVMEGTEEKKLGVLERAYKMAKQSYELSPRYGLTTGALYYSANQLARTHLKLDNYDLANKYNEISIGTADGDEQDDRESILSAGLSLRGQIAVAQEHYTEAVEAYHEEAATLRHYLEDKKLAPKMAADIGRVASSLAVAANNVLKYAKPLDTKVVAFAKGHLTFIENRIKDMHPEYSRIPNAVSTVCNLMASLGKNALETGELQQFHDYANRSVHLRLEWISNSAHEQAQHRLLQNLTVNIRNLDSLTQKKLSGSALSKGTALAVLKMCEDRGMPLAVTDQDDFANQLPWLVCRSLARQALTDGNNKEASQWLTKAAAFLRKGWTGDVEQNHLSPHLADAMRDLAKMHIDELKKIDDGKQIWLEAITWRKQICETASGEDKVACKRSLAVYYQHLSDRLKSNSRKDEALTYVKQAADIGFSNFKAGHLKGDTMLIFSLSSQASLERELGKMKEATTTYQKLNEVRDTTGPELVKAWPPNVKSVFASAAENLGLIHEKAKRLEQAEKAYREGLELWLQPGMVAYGNIDGKLVATRLKARLASLYAKTDRREDPLLMQWYHEIYATLHPLAEKNSVPKMLDWVYITASKSIENEAKEKDKSNN